MDAIKNSSAVTEAVRQFVYQQFPKARQEQIGDQASLLDSGIVDSLGLLDIVTWIETEFDASLNDDDLVSENFETIHSISELIQSRTAA